MQLISSAITKIEMPPLPQFRKDSLLRRARIHRSYLNEHPEELEHNERLEFLGDAVLGFLIGEHLYRRYPEMNEGKLTLLRSALVDEKQLAKFATDLSIGDMMLLGKGANLDGGRQSPKLLSSTFEAIIGAYFLDSGIEAVRAFVEPLFAPVAERIVASQSDVNFKSLFQAWALAQFGENPKYSTIDEFGPDHAKEFIAQVCVGGKEYGRGKGHSKPAAEKRAAEAALKKLGLV